MSREWVSGRHGASRRAGGHPGPAQRSRERLRISQHEGWPGRGSGLWSRGTIERGTLNVSLDRWPRGGAEVPLRRAGERRPGRSGTSALTPGVSRHLQSLDPHSSHCKRQSRTAPSLVPWIDLRAPSGAPGGDSRGIRARHPPGAGRNPKESLVAVSDSQRPVPGAHSRQLPRPGSSPQGRGPAEGAGRGGRQGALLRHRHRPRTTSPARWSPSRAQGGSVRGPTARSRLEVPPRGHWRASSGAWSFPSGTSRVASDIHSGQPSSRPAHGRSPGWAWEGPAKSQRRAGGGPPKKEGWSG